MKNFGLLIGCILFLLSACNTTDDSGKEDATTSAVDTGSGSGNTDTVNNTDNLDTGSSDDTSNEEDVNVGPPGTPVLLSATLVMHGTMSLSWQTPDSGCDTVEINRKQDAGSYSVAQRLTGVATSAQDEPGHANGTYCYTVTCVLGGVSSPPSNEQCITQ